MKAKTYHPFNVDNPTSLQHVVRLQPRQQVCLSLDTDRYPNSKITISKGCLSYQDLGVNNGRHKYLISANELSNDWAKYSSALLGNVWVDSDDTIACLCVMQTCNNDTKRHVVTAVNPESIDVRLKPGDIMEVILCDPDCDNEQYWFWDWVKALPVGIELLGSSDLLINRWHQYHEYMHDDHPDCLYARFPRTKTTDNNLRQYHFWFRLNHDLLNVMKHYNGVHHIGTLAFFCYGDRRRPNEATSYYRLSVWMDIDVELIKEVSNSLFISSKQSLTSTCDRDLLSVAPKLNLTTQIANVHNYKVTKYANLIREVTVSCIASPSLEDGCTVLSAEVPQDDYREGAKFFSNSASLDHHLQHIWKRNNYLMDSVEYWD